LTHPKDKIRDTGLYEPFRGKYSAGKMPSLKKVVKGELDVDVQVSEHDSVINPFPFHPSFMSLDYRTRLMSRLRMRRLRWCCLEELGWSLRRRYGWVI